jgi:thimet oligopeptidase
MKKQTIQLLLCSMIVAFLATLSYCAKTTQQDTKMINKAFHTQDIISLFAVTPENIATNTPLYIAEAKEIIDTIIAIDDHERTYANTARPLDEVFSLSNLAIAQHIYEALELLHPDDATRNAAHDAYITIQAFWVDYVMSNKKLYNAFTAYASQQIENEGLSAQQRYFVNDTIDSFKREGLSLPDETLAQANALRKELAALSADFDRNIAQDNRTITVTRNELEGLDDDFIATLRKSDDSLYILGVDYPTYFRVMENCSIAETRKKLYIAFSNRAYPINEELLKTIIVKRDELAKLLGYIDYAHADIDSQMAATPEKAQAFISDMTQRAAKKTDREFATLTQTLPASVELTADGKMQPWDMAYVQNIYKKTRYNLDEQKIAEYFPMQKTVEELLDIYRQFFSIDFEEVPATGLWSDDATVVRVLSSSAKASADRKDNAVIGTLILDLYPRPNKYSHAAHTTIVPATYKPDGTLIPDVSIVIANFTKPTATQPSLLKRSEVETFFHEFGHALHAILGATEIASLSGTHTKTDFVELPSQMLEEWLVDKEMLKKVSGHYITGQPLPDDIIDTIIELKNLTSGYFVTRQTYLASMALSYFGQGEQKDPHTIMSSLHNKIMHHSEFSEDNHFYASFGHLTGYGAKYYGYLWSKVFALDIFAEIKKHGLLNPEIGHKYVKEILSKGGAQDPNELLYNFLGREPNTQAFFEEMGL